MRGALAVAAALVGGVSVAHAMALSLRSTSVDRAYALAPWDGRIAGLMSEKILESSATPADRAAADRVALEALLRDPTAVAAVATRGLNAQIRGDTVGARRLLAYSDKMSRRDFRTRVWAIEDAVARGDVPDVLRHYDIALRTSRLAPDLLFPVLASAIDDPAISDALVRTLKGRPVWSEGFLRYLASTSQNPTTLVRLFTALNQGGVITSDDLNALALERLVASSSYAQAWSVYSRIRGDGDRARSRDPHFVSPNMPPTVFDWVPITNDIGLTAAIRRGDRGDRGGIVDFSAPSSVGGLLLQQLQWLPPGRYMLEGRSIGIDQPIGSRPYWTLACPDGRELGRVDLANSSEAGGRFAGHFTVPAGCPAQYLQFVAKPSSLETGLSGQIAQALLRPVR